MTQPAEQIMDHREMRQRIARAAHRGERLDGKSERWLSGSASSALARNILVLGEHEGWSGEDTMTALAYHALLRNENATDQLIKLISMSPSPRFAAPPSAHLDPGDVAEWNRIREALERRLIETARELLAHSGAEAVVVPAEDGLEIRIATRP